MSYSYPNRPPKPVVVEIPEHRCSKCYGPYGKSAIRCVNEPVSPREQAVAFLAKRAEIREGN